MEILDQELSPKDFESFANQNLSIDTLSEGFSKASINFYKNKKALWQNLRPFFQSSRLSKSIQKNGVLMKGAEITSSILSEAIEYFSRAFCNFYAQEILIQHGYCTWSEITNYYSSFFGIHSLLRLQGRCITRIWRPKGKQVYIFPYDLHDHKYVICTKGVKGKSAHEAAWSLYYEVYDGFVYAENLNFESIFKKKYVGTPEEELDFRNKVNYEPYQGYEEIRDLTKIPAFIKSYAEKEFTNNEIEMLSRLTTDPDYRYYARSALRIIFCYSLFMRIAQKNEELDSLFADCKNTLSDFLNLTKPRKKNGMLGRKLQSMLDLRSD